MGSQYSQSEGNGSCITGSSHREHLSLLKPLTSVSSLPFSISLIGFSSHPPLPLERTSATILSRHDSPLNPSALLHAPFQPSIDLVSLEFRILTPPLRALHLVRRDQESKEPICRKEEGENEEWNDEEAFDLGRRTLERARRRC